MEMNNYYSKKLSSSKLQKCYEIAPLRVKQYLKAEIDFVLERINSTDLVLELGCGYGRVLKRLIGKARTVVGIDASEESIQLARSMIGSNKSCQLYRMNAVEIKFEANEFDVVICIQNGISAFQVEPRKLIREAIRVTRSGGTILFSSYSEKFWEERLNWFKIQADNQLIGEIDYSATGNGIIVCMDGFKATTFTAEEFLMLASNFPVTVQIHEVDNSSIFCEMERF